ncbi:MAP kinase kinase [Trichophyton interdigitale]|uniref:MAP kinase kinase n=1 Tax=Trichophyton interdigitale TaxID=101480 RepID=A0A9P5CX96_9EURO|nr:MAP kinase kinase [Trichophyton interdigitale]KAF3899671.1 MAP kinase kinase [Trichophyton interdigitale]KAG8209230.1 MAP kinase kinase [Trichophyton interdigitale]
MADAFKARSLKRKNVKGLALNSAASKPGLKPSEGDAQIPGAIGNVDSNRTDTLEIGLEFKLDLRSEDLIVLKELGAGNGGTVSKVMHASTKVVMARKIIRVDAKEKVRKQILRELQVGHDCNSAQIVTFYGAFQNEARDIVLCMEYMDCGSLDHISKNFGPVRVDVLGKITESIFAGLVYLYEAHRIMHRDIKPSNVLVNSRGSIKLCDFGVATETVNSIADTFVGTSTYMAPERIQGGAYSVRSDVWSAGLTVMELAVGRFPFDTSDTSAGDRASAGPMGILDLLQQIVHEPAPKLPKSDAFPKILDDFVAKCLLKKPEERPTPRQLYDHDAFILAAKRTPVNLREWAISMMEQHNRKSYLAPPAPKAITRDGGSGESPSSSGPHTPDETPRQATSGEIPLNIAGDITPRSRPQATYGIEHSPSMGFEKLSLNTNQAQHYSSGSVPRSSRSPYPHSATSTSQGPFAAPRPAPSPVYHTTRNGSQSAGLPHLAGPPPKGPLPVPPTSDSWRSQSQNRI